MNLRWLPHSVVLAVMFASAATSALAQDPLASWNDVASKQAVVAFVAKVTTAGGPDFVRPAERIAVFDNDGTLWCEQPMYVQLAFAIDRVKALAPQHPDWQEKEPFKSVLAGDVSAALAGGEKAAIELIAATHAGMTTDEFERTVREWISTAKHPKTGRLYVQMTYQPMQELLAYLRANGFKTFIVSGGGVEFMRPWTERVYGIPPEQVVGSRGRLKYEVRDGVPTLVKLPEIDLIDDEAGKPVGIQQMIGRRPIAAFGNSDGDFEMLEWTTAGSGARLGMIVHHTDAEREYAYDRDSHIGQLARALDEAPKRGWVVIDMKNDWNTVFRPEQQAGASGGAALLGNWRLVSLEGSPVPAGVEVPTLSVANDGSVSGSTGVNRLGGKLSAADGALFGPMITTRRAGPPEAMQVESSYLAALGKVNRFERNGQELKLYAGDQMVLTFESGR